MMIFAGQASIALTLECTGLHEYKGNKYLYSFVYDYDNNFGTLTESHDGQVYLEAKLDCTNYSSGNFIKCDKQDGKKYKKVEISNIGFGKYAPKFLDETSKAGG